MSGPRAWQPGRLSPGGEAVHAKLTGRRGMVLTSSPPQPQPPNPVAAQLSDRPQAPPSLAEMVNHLTAMHAPGHPHVTGTLQPDQPDLNPGQHFVHPDNLLDAEDWDG